MQRTRKTSPVCALICTLKLIRVTIEDHSKIGTKYQWNQSRNRVNSYLQLGIKTKNQLPKEFRRNVTLCNKPEKVKCSNHQLPNSYKAQLPNNLNHQKTISYNQKTAVGSKNKLMISFNPQKLKKFSYQLMNKPNLQKMRRFNPQLVISCNPQKVISCNNQL